MTEVPTAPTLIPVLARRRHRLIWTAVGSIHLVALGAVWFGGAGLVSDPVREGGLIMVTLLPEPVALPGEAKEGAAQGAGLPLAIVPTALAVVVPAFTPVTPQTAVLPVSPVVATVPAGVAGPTSLAAPVLDVFVPPAFRARQEPLYPERARRAGAEGVVGVRIALAADGTIRLVELTRSSGSRLLDEAALTAARASTFAPASRNRLPVAAEAEASYRFELR